MFTGRSTIVTVATGVCAWLLAWAAIDWLVLLLYPIPPGLWETASMRDIIASRPNAAVALNLGGETVVLTATAFMASRWTTPRSARAGVWITTIVLILAVVNSLATANFRWIHGIGFALFLVCGLAAANRGATSA